MRWKNPHPKRAVNARTVLKGDLLEEEQPPLAKVLCLKIPPPVVDDDDDDEVVGDVERQMRLYEKK